MDLVSDSELQSTTEDLFSTYNLEGFEDTPRVPFVGLRNLGNSCFFNSVLQILFYCPEFQNLLEAVAKKIKINVDEETDDKENLLLELHRLFVTMKTNQGILIDETGQENDQENAKAVRPNDLMDILRKIYPAFEPYTQQDAQECLRCILGILDDATMNLEGKKNDVFPPVIIKEKSCKLMGGRKFGSTAVASSSTENSRENQDPTLSSIKQESRTTASRKKNMRSILRKPLKVKPTVSNNQSKTKHESVAKGNQRLGLKENSNCLNEADPGCFNRFGKKHTALSENDKNTKDSVQLLHTPTKRPNQCDISALSPPAKRKKLSLCNGIRSFYKPFTSKLQFEKKKTYSVADSENTSRKNPFKMLLKSNSSSEYKKLEEKGVDMKLNEDGVSVKKIESLNGKVSSIPSNVTDNKVDGNFVEDLFQGKLVNVTRCMECENCVYRDEPFMDVSLPVRGGSFTTGCSKDNKSSDNLEAVDSDDEDDTNVNCSVVWGLSAFTSREILKGENKYYCSKCCRYVEGERRLQFHSIPPILTFHLKRFTTSKPLGGGDAFCSTVSKINSCLNVPLELCLDEWCSKTCANREFKYTLFGIIIHSGVTISSGHYLTYARLDKSLTGLVDYSEGVEERLESYDGKWLEADDERTRVVSQKELLDVISPKGAQGVSRTPYLLFYSRNTV